MRLITAAGLAAAVRDLRPDAVALGIEITTGWCRDQMHDLGVTRYEDVDRDLLHAIADRVDLLGAGDVSHADAYTMRMLRARE